MASLPCLQTSRQEKGEAPEFTKLDSIARKILAFFALISFPKVIVGLFLWQHDIKQITLLIKWLHMKLLPSCKRGGTDIAVEWMNSFIQEPSVWWLIGPPTWGKCWSPPVLRWFLSPDTLEFLCSLTLLILSVFPSTPCFLSMDYCCMVVKWCLWQETWGDRWKAHGLKSHQVRIWQISGWQPWENYLTSYSLSFPTWKMGLAIEIICVYILGMLMYCM